MSDIMAPISLVQVLTFPSHFPCFALQEACQKANEALVYRMEFKRPFSVLKYAMTLDGKIAASTGHAAWVSGKESRQKVFVMRGRSDAIIVGGNTVRRDSEAAYVLASVLSQVRKVSHSLMMHCIGTRGEGILLLIFSFLLVKRKKKPQLGALRSLWRKKVSDVPLRKSVFRSRLHCSYPLGGRPPIYGAPRGGHLVVRIVIPVCDQAKRYAYDSRRNKARKKLMLSPAQLQTAKLENAVRVATGRIIRHVLVCAWVGIQAIFRIAGFGCRIRREHEVG